MSERVFVDTSAYYSLADRGDANHTPAVARAHSFGQDGVDLFTSNFVVAETHTLMLNRLGYDIAVQVLERLYTSATRIIRATEVDERRGREIVVQHKDKDYSLVDAIRAKLRKGRPAGSDIKSGGAVVVGARAGA